MAPAESLETKINTPITNIGIHASLPNWTVETGKSYIIPSIVVIGESTPYLSLIGNQASQGATLSLSSIRAAAQQKKDRKYVQYISQFSKDWNLKRPHFASFTKDFVWDKFKSAIHQFLQLKPDFVSFNLTDDCSIFFKGIVKENNIYLELFFDNETEDNVEAIVNIYKDGKVVIAYGGGIENTFEKIQELLVNKDKIPVSTPLPNAISEPYFATAEF
ncbi:hypothetical protein [Chryseolinea sp. H1M3-3]|uniref:hypothetical protein n=1 Tax=Chryseolinea sp. H1M3-3 TaxID=3034144 RepID=UPI0023EDEE1A|nr:hypothetical protein [Chryseolinea sp. H1M3-3]